MGSTYNTGPSLGFTSGHSCYQMYSKIFFNPNKPNNVSFYCLIKHWLGVHSSSYCVSLLLPDRKCLFYLIFVTKLNLIVGEQNGMEIDAYLRSPGASSHLLHVKRPFPLSFKLSIVLKTVVAFKSEIYPAYNLWVILKEEIMNRWDCYSS